MRILLTGATGYIGKRLLPILIENGHDVICCARDVNRFSPPKSLESKIEVIQVDLLKQETLKNIPSNKTIINPIKLSFNSPVNPKKGIIEIITDQKQ